MSDETLTAKLRRKRKERLEQRPGRVVTQARDEARAAPAGAEWTGG